MGMAMIIQRLKFLLDKDLMLKMYRYCLSSGHGREGGWKPTGRGLDFIGNK